MGRIAGYVIVFLLGGFCWSVWSGLRATHVAPVAASKAEAPVKASARSKVDLSNWTNEELAAYRDWLDAKPARAIHLAYGKPAEPGYHFNMIVICDSRQDVIPFILVEMPNGYNVGPKTCAGVNIMDLAMQEYDDIQAQYDKLKIEEHLRGGNQGVNPRFERVAPAATPARP